MSSPYLSRVVLSICIALSPSKYRVHIRRTDKVDTEAGFHPIEEYMQHVEEWYQQQQKQGMDVTTKRVYLATDEPDLIDEANQKYYVG